MFRISVEFRNHEGHEEHEGKTRENKNRMTTFVFLRVLRGDDNGRISLQRSNARRYVGSTLPASHQPTDQKSKRACHASCILACPARAKALLLATRFPTRCCPVGVPAGSEAYVPLKLRFFVARNVSEGSWMFPWSLANSLTRRARKFARNTRMRKIKTHA